MTDDFPTPEQSDEYWLEFLNKSHRKIMPPGFPTIITLCGSTRFQKEYEAATRRLTLEGNIVISVGMFGHKEGIDMGGPIKAKLDVLHLRKIDLADEIFVINVKGYIGESTKREIAYATKRGKIIRYLEES